MDLGSWELALELFGEIISLLAEFVPGISVVWSGGGQMGSVVVLVNDAVPDSMELVGLVVALEWEVVSTLVAFWVLFAVSVAAVEWLMDVTHVVDDETESQRFALVLRLHVLHNGLVGGG